VHGVKARFPRQRDLAAAWRYAGVIAAITGDFPFDESDVAISSRGRVQGKVKRRRADDSQCGRGDEPPPRCEPDTIA
jgi:hypothetical protein